MTRCCCPAVRRLRRLPITGLASTAAAARWRRSRGGSRLSGSALRPVLVGGGHAGADLDGAQPVVEPGARLLGSVELRPARHLRNRRLLSGAVVSAHGVSLDPVTDLWAALVATAVSLVLAIPSLRLRGIYVSLLTFGFAEVVRLLIISDKSGDTGGTFGLSGFDGYGLQTMEPDQRARVIYWIALAGVLVTLIVIFFIIRSPSRHRIDGSSRQPFPCGRPRGQPAEVPDGLVRHLGFLRWTCRRSLRLHLRRCVPLTHGTGPDDATRDDDGDRWARHPERPFDRHCRAHLCSGRASAVARVQADHARSATARDHRGHAAWPGTSAGGGPRTALEVDGRRRGTERPITPWLVAGLFRRQILGAMAARASWAHHGRTANPSTSMRVRPPRSIATIFNVRVAEVLKRLVHAST